MSNRCYVCSAAQISCQGAFTSIFDEVADIIAGEGYVRAVEPDMKGLLSPCEMRRMSRILKRGVASSLKAIELSGLEGIYAIITGTGSGCIENSEKFLADVSRFKETCLKPTLFMQSTHNTISSQIAIVLKCKGYNCTYSHKGISFESALLDAWLRLRQGNLDNALVGCHDEVTPLFANVIRKCHPEFNLISEHSVSAVVSGNPEKAVCEVESVSIIHNPTMQELASRLSDEELVICGMNGNILNDSVYTDVFRLAGISDDKILRYKDIYGECFSSSAIGFFIGVELLQKGYVPAHLVNDGANKVPERIVLINHTDMSDWGITVLKKV